MTLDELIFKEKKYLLDELFLKIITNQSFIFPVRQDKFLTYDYVKRHDGTKEQKLLLCMFCKDVDPNFAFEFEPEEIKFLDMIFFWFYYKLFGYDDESAKMFLNDIVIPNYYKPKVPEEKHVLEKDDDGKFYVDDKEMDILEIFKLDLTSKQMEYLIDELSNMQ